MTRPEVIARIVSRVQHFAGAAPGELAHDRPLKGQEIAAGTIDSLDLVDIEMEIEDAFDLPANTLDLQPDASIDNIADAVITAQGSAR